MDTLYFLIGALAVFIALVFFGFILLVWGLRQLFIIRNQNDAIISFLQQISVSIWNEPHSQARLGEGNRDTAVSLERGLKMNRQVQG
ncbi:MAG: hypothetical protein WAU47_13400 [Desulfobaccales bacterium]